MRYVAVILALLLLGCDMPTAFERLPRSFTVHGATEIHAPASWAAEYAAAEDCVGIRGDFDGVRWFLADSIVWQGQRFIGMWTSRREIFLKRRALDARLVRHESLHDILRTGSHDHPAFGICDVHQNGDWRF